MEPTEVQKRSAGGRIPLSFDMHESEVTSLHRPPTFYVMAPRLSYLPLVSRSARESFQEAAPDVGESGIWFEYDNKPLRWNIPVGVLFDYHGNNSNGKDDIPFKIIIRFQGFPKSNLIPCAGELDAEKVFFHSMKQALCLRYGSAKKLMDMPRPSQESLWEGVVFGKFEKYWQSCSNILVSEGEKQPQVPIRVIVRTPETANEIARSIQGAVPWTEDMTLQRAVETILTNNEKYLDVNKCRVVVQGVHPPLDAPLTDVWLEMCSYDLFLYIVVKMD
jgi:autophagy-related protein 5